MEDALESEADMHEWFSRDTKSGVVLHDRLMTDAALGALPIKTEHSYSLNSDGDSAPASPRDMHTRVDGTLLACFLWLDSLLMSIFVTSNQFLVEYHYKSSDWTSLQIDVIVWNRSGHLK